MSGQGPEGDRGPGSAAVGSLRLAATARECLGAMCLVSFPGVAELAFYTRKTQVGPQGPQIFVGGDPPLEDDRVLCALSSNSSFEHNRF